MNSTRGWIGVALAIIVALLGATNVMASGGAVPLRQGGAPGQLSYQGLLLDPATGDPVADGDYTLTFAIYDHATSTAPSHRLWNETQTVSVQDGLFNVMLGAVTPITTTWLDGRDLWLGSTVQGEGEMTPRTPLVSVPYALNAKDVRGTDIHPDHVYASNGVEVGSAGADGVYVDTAGSPSMASSSSAPDGFEVAGAEGDGLSVGRADNIGVRVVSAGDDGVYVGSAGNPSTTRSSSDPNGFEVAGAEEVGLYIGRADHHGVQVYSAGHNGVSVGSASYDGVYVGSAGTPSMAAASGERNGFEVAGAEGAGLYVGHAHYGVVVGSAGTPSTTSVSSDPNGFEVAGAEGNGLYVGQADINGVHVQSAGGDGLVVQSAGRYGVWVISAGDYAGYFLGDMHVSGTINKGAVGFKIDHPLDPQGKYLYHSGVESPDMMNVYNGNVTLDASGEAWVELPAWFEALNRDYRYQLTCIGGFAPVYIAQEVQDNRFQIAGGTPGMEVSWQVTGIRHDPYAEARRIPVEEDKPHEERGTYIHPKAYGQPEAMGLDYKEAQAQGYDLSVLER